MHYFFLDTTTDQRNTESAISTQIVHRVETQDQHIDNTNDDVEDDDQCYSHYKNENNHPNNALFIPNGKTTSDQMTTESAISTN